MASRSTASYPAHAEINVTPLIDVMLVLLIIFMIAAPVATASLQLDLPRGQPEPPPVESQALRLDAAGRLHWLGHPVERRQLDHLLRQGANSIPQPALLIAIADGNRYQQVAEVMASARSAGYRRISLASD